MTSKRNSASDCSDVDSENNSREVAAGEDKSDIELVVGAIEVCSPKAESNNEAGVSEACAGNDSVAIEDDHLESAQESDAEAISTRQAVTMFPWSTLDSFLNIY